MSVQVARKTVRVLEPPRDPEKELWKVDMHVRKDQSVVLLAPRPKSHSFQVLFEWSRSTRCMVPVTNQNNV